MVIWAARCNLILASNDLFLRLNTPIILTWRLRRSTFTALRLGLLFSILSIVLLVVFILFFFILRARLYFALIFRIRFIVWFPICEKFVLEIQNPRMLKNAN